MSVSLNLANIVERAQGEDIAYVYDAPFHFIVLTRKDNVWSNATIARYLAVLDQIEATKGPGVLVTIGTGAKHFSTGFDLPWWSEKWDNFKSSIEGF